MAVRGRLPSGIVVVDDGVVLYVIHDPRGPTITIPSGTSPLRVDELIAALARAEPAQGADPTHLRATYVAAAASTPAGRIGAIADVLASSGRCFIPVGRWNGDCAPNDPACHDKLVVAGDGCSIAAADAHHVTVDVAKDHYWIGISGINEWQETPPTTGQNRDLDRLETTLIETKSAPEFGDRADIEITADPSVAYQDLLDAWAASIRAGWALPQLVSQKRASYLPPAP
jgi:hypothetical protein